MKWSRHWRL